MAVKQILNALDLIEFFARTRKPATLAEIQQQFGWPRSSAYNILSTLVERGYLYEPGRRGGYYPTPRLARVGETIMSADPMNERLAELLRNLAEETGETAVLAAPAGRYSVYLDVIESSSPIRYAGHVGQKFPMHAVASGRALLSLYGDAERAGILAKTTYKAYGPNALMSPEDVEAEITASLERGWFLSLHEYNADLVALAMPIQVDERRLAVVVAGPVYRLEHRCEEVAQCLGRLIAEAGFAAAAHSAEVKAAV